MAYRVAINGYGRIGQSVLRAIYERGLQHELQLVALNELSDIDTVTYLTRYDTTHGRFPLPVSNDGESLLIADDRIRVLNQEDPRKLPWDELAVDLVLECSGSFSSRAMAEQHLAAGAARLLFSQPAQADVDATIVCGVNQHSLKASDRIVSAASCTTNCVIPILDLLDRHFGIEHGVTTTIHSAMNDQPVIDSYHRTDLRLTRSALQSIIPVDTGLDRGIDRLLPQLAGRFRCLHVRVPTINVSLMDMSLNLRRDTSAEEVNALMRAAAESGPLLGLLGYTEEPHASVDFNRDPRSGVVDGTQTRVAGERMLKLMCWFDNEWGFANRMLDVAQHWLHLR
ncbi:erythrose-4-phosphate dehydrogenase [Marinobacterium sp. D7]|uniref:type I glyceraldehyde-3-phosphate dehydrogenase n=1 Tax=Marinobacterium ramblicola TaxID=2849041 RepID=UPI001C2D2B73|nr:glyceraldehyde 3-phosphate dehydrogenase NAD-binding domain-containing protein [Marinobacterium ramblicola]MBV1788407.1 erythrose-4-phosphate dehydrogenase [Marinobacterium ramblicola]